MTRTPGQADGGAAPGALILPGQAAYPVLLARIASPPPLWLMGAPATGRLVAVVGTRHPDEEGRLVARALASELAERGYGVVAGLADGIDAEAHRACLRAGGRTWAVVGSGLDLASSGEDPGLPSRIAAQGGLLSEVEPGRPATNQSLVARDRLQSGMSLATVIVQTDLRSGTMHTARFCLLQHRPLVVVSPPRHSPRWAGNLALSDPRGCDPALLHARGKTAELVGRRRPVADLVLATDRGWEPLWQLLEQLAP